MGDVSIRAVITGDSSHARQAVTAFNRDLQESGRVVSEAANQLVGRFTPGVDNAIRAVSQMATGLNRLSGGLTGLAGVAAGVAATIAGQYVDAWAKARASTLEFNRALDSGDFSRVTSESQKLRLELEGLRETYDKLTRAQKDNANAPPTLSPYLSGRPAQAAHVLSLNQQAVQQQQTDIYGRFIGSQEQGAALQGIDQSQAARLEQIKTANAQRSLYDFRLSAIESEYQQSLRQAEDLARGVGTVSQDPAAAARLRGAAAERRRFRFAGEILGPGIQSAAAPFEGFEAGLLTGPTQTETQTGVDRRNKELVELLVEGITQAMQHPLAGVGLEQIGIGPTLAETGAGIKARIADTTRLKEIEVERARVLAEQVGLTASEQAAIQSSIIEAQRRLEIEKAQGRVEEENLANFTAAVRQQAIARAELERTNATFGFEKAARELEQDWGAIGLRVQEGFRDVAGEVQQTLATIIRGDTIGKDFGKQFADSFKSIVANEISKFIVGQASGAIRGLLGGAGGGGFFNVTGASPNELSNLLTQGYQLVGGAGGSTFAVSSGTLTGPGGVSVAAPGGGGGGYFNVPGGSGLIDVAADYGFQAASAAGLTQYSSLLAFQQGQGVVQGSAAYYGNASVSGAVAGALPALPPGVSYAGVAAAVARLGYGAYDIATNRGYSSGEEALLALHHAGLAVADLYTFGLAELGPLIGGLIGDDNILGQILTGIPAFIRPSIPRRVREALSVRDVLVPNANDLIGRINAAATPELLYSTLADWGSGSTGGHAPIAVITLVNGKMIGQGGGGNYATVDDLLDHVDTFQAFTQYGVAQNFLTDVNNAVEEAVKAKVAQLNAVLAPLPFGYVERGYFKDASGADVRSSPYLTRTTQQVGGALTLGQLKPGTQDLFFSREIYKEMGVDDATIDSMIRRLNSWTINRDMLTDIGKERFLAAF